MACNKFVRFDIDISIAVPEPNELIFSIVHDAENLTFRIC